MLLASTTYVDAKKPEKNYLPEAGDVTIGVNAVPFLNYLGNMFGKVDDNKINPKKSAVYQLFRDLTILQCQYSANTSLQTRQL